MYKKKVDFKYTGSTKKDIPIHTVPIEWIDFDMHEKAAKIL